MNKRPEYLSLILGIVVLVGLYLVSTRNYLLFHGVAEMFSVVIAFCIFIIAWNSRRLIEHSYLLFIGIAYLFVGGLDLIHTFAYTGMGVFPGATTDLPTQLWISARWMESLSLLVAPFLLGRRLRVNLVLLVYAAAAALFIGSIFHWGIFPTCFIEDSGLTAFKKISEYVISFILLGSIIALVKKREHFDLAVLRLVIASITLTVASELAFTFYIHAYGLSNLVGHYLKIVSFFLIYKALIETGLRKPYDLMFRELKQREEALTESEEKFRALAENAPDIIARLDCDFRFLYVNPAVRSLAGVSPGDLMNKTLDQAGLAEPLRDAWKSAVLKTCSSSQADTSEIQLPVAGGDRFLRLTVVPEMPAISPVGTVLSVVSDVTEIREAEEITRRDKETLEKLVRQRSKELLEAHRKLADAKRLSGIGALAATVAHELRNPLGVIQTALYNIRRKTSEPALDKHLVNIEKKISESDQIISNLLRYSRIRPPEYERASLYSILSDSIAAAEERFTGCRISVAADIGPIAEQTVEIDTVQIQEVFDNILNNAYQAVSDTEGTIRIAGRLTPDRTVSITISDTGPGMDPETLERAFEPFFTRKSRGTGLGLTICRELVQLHGGTIDITSRSGAGTTVTVALPLSSPEA